MKFLPSDFAKLAATVVVAALPAGAAWADIKIGFNVPLTGFAAADGKSALEGAKLAIAQANAQGGVAGQKLELVVYDDQASPKEAVPSVTTLRSILRASRATSSERTRVPLAGPDCFSSVGFT